MKNGEIVLSGREKQRVLSALRAVGAIRERHAQTLQKIPGMTGLEIEAFDTIETVLCTMRDQASLTQDQAAKITGALKQFSTGVIQMVASWRTQLNGASQNRATDVETIEELRHRMETALRVTSRQCVAIRKTIENKAGIQAGAEIG